MKTRTMVITIFFCLVLSVSAAGAATLSTASGTFANGQQVIITGSGFGTVVPSGASLITAENGTTGSPLSETGWTYSSASTDGGWSSPVYSSAKALNGTKSILCSYPKGTYGCAFSLGGSQPITKAYISFWFYGDYKAFAAAPNNYFQWKMLHMSPSPNYGTIAPMFMVGQWPQSDGTCAQALSVNFPDTSYNIWTPDNNYWRTCFPRGEWVRMEVLLQESDPGVANGTEIVRYYSSKANSWTIWTNYSKNTITRAATITDRWMYVHMGHYIGNDAGGKDVDTYWDNIYVQQGTYARVELCDSSSWSTCKKREVQKPVSWSASSITISANSGPFATGETAYLFFIDDAGNASNALTVKIGSASTTKTPTTLKRR